MKGKDDVNDDDNGEEDRESLGRRGVKKPRR